MFLHPCVSENGLPLSEVRKMFIVQSCNWVGMYCLIFLIDLRYVHFSDIYLFISNYYKLLF